MWHVVWLTSSRFGDPLAKFIDRISSSAKSQKMARVDWFGETLDLTLYNSVHVSSCYVWIATPLNLRYTNVDFSNLS